VARELHETGVAEAVHCDGGTQRFRLVSFGGTRPQQEPSGYDVVPLEDVLAFLEGTLRANPEVFKVVDFKDPALAMLSLRRKLGGG